MKDSQRYYHTLQCQRPNESQEENVIQQLEELQNLLTKDQTSFQGNFVQTKDLISQMALTLAFVNNEDDNMVKRHSIYLVQTVRP